MTVPFVTVILLFEPIYIFDPNYNGSVVADNVVSVELLWNSPLPAIMDVLTFINCPFMLFIFALLLLLYIPLTTELFAKPYVAVRASLKFNIFVVKLLFVDVLHVIFPFAYIVWSTLKEDPFIVNYVPGLENTI